MDLKEAVITSIKNVTTVYSPKGRCVEMKDRICYGLTFCIDGQITYVQNGKTYVSDKDHALLLPQGESYSLHGDRTGRFPVINFYCLEPLCNTVTVLPVPNREAILKDYAELERLFLYGGNQPKLMSVLYGILHKLTADTVPHVLKGALSRMQSGYGDPALTNAVLAQECNVSEVYFRKLFLSEMRTTPRQYLIELRINRARQLLSEGKYKIVAVSEKCGFSNPYHFCRSFKVATGETPTEYMMRNKRVQI